MNLMGKKVRPSLRGERRAWKEKNKDGAQGNRNPTLPRTALRTSCRDCSRWRGRRQAARGISPGNLASFYEFSVLRMTAPRSSTVKGFVIKFWNPISLMLSRVIYWL